MTQIRCIAVSEDRLGEGMTYRLDGVAKTVVPDRSLSPYDLVDICEHSPDKYPATEKNIYNKSDFLPALAVVLGYCPGVGLCIIRATRTGQIEYEPLGT